MHVAVLPVNCIRAENCVYSIDNSNEIFNSDELELESLRDTTHVTKATKNLRAFGSLR